MDGYMDFGSSDSDGDDSNDFDEEMKVNVKKDSRERQPQLGQVLELDSDEEEQVQNAELLKIMTKPMPHKKTRKECEVEDFETEMEAELDRRTLKIEVEGGVRHQTLQAQLETVKNQEASTSASSLFPLPGPSNPVQGSSKDINKPKSLLKVEGPKPEEAKKSVSFEDSKKSQQETEVPIDKQFYDDIYYDSDESDGGTGGDKREKRAVLSPDQLLYDPNADSKDQDWMDRRRVSSYGSKNQGRKLSEVEDEIPEPITSSFPTTSSSNSKSKSNIPNLSDAVLNCPACFTVLCMDCQRHEIYKEQYRAMFVMNCSVKKDQTVSIPMKTNTKRKRKFGGDLIIEGKGNQNSEISIGVSGEPGDIFNPVHCKVCNTQVAMYDSDEVYHFYNILTSHS